MNIVFQISKMSKMSEFLLSFILLGWEDDALVVLFCFLKFGKAWFTCFNLGVTDVT